MYGELLQTLPRLITTYKLTFNSIDSNKWTTENRGLKKNWSAIGIFVQLLDFRANIPKSPFSVHVQVLKTFRYSSEFILSSSIVCDCFITWRRLYIFYKLQLVTISWQLKSWSMRSALLYAWQKNHTAVWVNNGVLHWILSFCQCTKNPICSNKFYLHHNKQ